MRALAFVAALVGALSGCGGDLPVASPGEPTSSSPLVTTQTYRGSYQCGADWWHVEQTIQATSVLARNRSVALSAQLPAVNAADDPTANAVQLWCWSSPVPMTWGGFSYYNVAPMGGSPSNCIMWTHRRNAPWVNSATVDVRAGGLLFYSGNPSEWDITVRDAGGSGNHDGLAACGGHFLVSLQ